MKDGTFAIDRSDPEGGIPGRALSPQARGRARRNAQESARTRQRMAELSDRQRMADAVKALSPRAKRLWERLKQGCWYSDHTPTMQELIDANLVVFGGRVARVIACYMPLGTKPYVIEQIPGDLP